MNYVDARKQIKSGDIIGQIHGNLIGGRITQWWTRQDWTHVAVTRWVDESLWVYEAVMPLVRLYPLSLLTPFYWIPMNRDLSIEARNFASSKVGHHYGLDDCIKAGVTGYADPNNNREQCAEFANQIMRMNNWPFSNRDLPGAVIARATLLTGQQPIFVEADHA